MGLSQRVAPVPGNRPRWHASVIDPFIEPGLFFRKKFDSLGLMWTAYFVGTVVAVASQYLIGSAHLMALVKAGGLEPHMVGAARVLDQIPHIAVALTGPFLYAATGWCLVRLLGWNRPPFHRLCCIMIWGELLFAIGLLFKALMVVLTDNPDFSFSIQEIVFRLGFEPSATTYILSKFDIFLIWEILIVEAGLRVLFEVDRWKAIVVAVLSIQLIPSLLIVYLH